MDQTISVTLSLMVALALSCKPAAQDRRGIYQNSFPQPAQEELPADQFQGQNPGSGDSTATTQTGDGGGIVDGESLSLKGATVYILLHGLNSDAATWDVLVDRAFQGDCPVLNLTESDGAANITTCYRYNFITRNSADGTKWEHGDGATFDELGQEVAKLVETIRKRNEPGSIVLVGHSRGGLAARAYLQGLGAVAKDLRIALVTIGTPHLGTPMGQMKYYFDSKGIKPGDFPFDGVKFVASPSTGMLTQTIVSNNPSRTKNSEAIWKLTDGAASLFLHVDVLAQMYSVGLRLGENIAPGVDLFSSSFLNPVRTLPGDFDEMKDFVLNGVTDEWQNGDNMVPAVSAKIASLPGIKESKVPLFSSEMQKKIHADPIQFEPFDANPNEGITGQTDRIKLILKSVTESEGFTPFTVVE